MDLLCRRTLAGLVPIEDGALAHVPMGDVVKVTVTRPRNQRHHALFWALVALVHRNLPEKLEAHFPTAESLVALLKYRTGWCDSVFAKDGTKISLPRSIAFHKMDQVQFSGFFNRCCDIIAAEWLPGVTNAELRQEAESMLGMTSRAA